MFLSLQERMETEGLDLGNRVLKEAGGIESYDQKIRQTYKAILPEVSKKLFRAMNETSTDTAEMGITPKTWTPNNRG